MADDGSAQSTSVWPLPKFHFQVEWDSEQMSFQEVSGLDFDVQIKEYRNNDSPQFSTIKMPGIRKFGNVTMKKGVLKSDNKFWDWFNEIKMNTIKRKTVTIKLLDEAGTPTMTWTLANAWPTKITCSDMKSDGNEVAVESIEIVHEGITISDTTHLSSS
jgi:phage tail-like protein